MKTKSPVTLSLALAAVGCLIVPTIGAQGTPAQMLASRAVSLDNQGRHDLAAETWRQLLSLDPKNTQALSALANYYWSVGDSVTAKRYFSQLHQSAPAEATLNPEGAQRPSTDEATFEEAAKLAAKHRYAESLALYRRAFHGNRPAGTWALAYYETQAAVPGETQEAVAGLRSLVKQFPANPAYSLSLGRVLTYHPETRLEGVHLLESIKGTAAQTMAAREAWRHAILWDISGPAAAESSRRYLSRYPDAEVEAALKQAPSHQPRRVPVEGEAELGEAFAALSKGDLTTADRMFSDLTKVQPQRGKAYLGLGYVAMQRQDFDRAIQQYQQAAQTGLRSKELTDALTDAHFWGAMNNGEKSLKAHDTADAMRRFDQARELRPKDPNALSATGRAWMQMNQPEKAAALFEQSVKLDQTRSEDWTNWFGALVALGRSQEVLADQHYLPSTLSTQLAANPEYLAISAVAELQAGNEENYHRLLSQLHAVSETPKRVAAQLRCASLLLTVDSPREAARESLEVIRLDPSNVDAWKLVVVAEHSAKRDAMALTAIERMPPEVYATVQQDVDFAIMVASVQQSLHRYSDAQSVLDSAHARAANNSVAMHTIERQMASLALAQGRATNAVEGYSALLKDNPDEPDAWAGIISALHDAKQDRAARVQMERMPAAVAERLQRNPSYLQVAASVYIQTNDTAKGLEALAMARNDYRDRRQTVPYAVEAQRAWALIAVGDDNGVANSLVDLSHRADLTAGDQQQNKNLWAAWSVRKALRVEKQGEPKRALAILETASQAYPHNADIRRALAGIYVRSGNAKAAVALYEEIDWYAASKEDFMGAISAASAANRVPEGRKWVNDAIERFSGDPQILTAAAEFERSAGDMRKAKEYWRAVLNVPEQQLQEQLSKHSGANGTMSANEALMRMLAPHARAEDESAVPLGGSDKAEEGDDVLAMLPPSSPAATPRTITESATAPTQAASPWLVQQTDSLSKSAYKPMSYRRGDRPAKGMDEDLRHESNSSAGKWPSLASTAASGGVSYGSETASSAYRVDAAPYPSMTADEAEHSAATVQAEPAYLPHTSTAQLRRASLQAVESPSSDSSSSSSSSSSEANELPPTASSDAATREAFLSHASPAARRASEELQDLSSRLSPWAGGTVRIEGRSGTPGFDRLTRSEIEIEGSSVLGDKARITVITKPTFLTGGTPVANDKGVLDTPYNFGKSGAPLLNQPHFQSGLGGELQIASRFVDGKIGYTPSTFYVSNVVGAVNLHPEHVPFKLGIYREPITQTILSYAGERDPLTGDIWGGVLATGVRGGVSKGTEESGFYTDVSVAKLTGTHVNDNRKIEGSAGSYWTFYRDVYGSLKIGANVTGLHYDQNQRFFTFGQGGYFSPSAYLLVNAPFTWEGRSNRLAYTISGSLGLQSFNEDTALAGSLSTTAPTAQSVIGANYNLAGNFSYKLDEHWYIGTFFGVNNASNYQDRSGGFSVRYTRLPQVQSVIGPTGLIDNQAPRPLIIP